MLCRRCGLCSLIKAKILPQQSSHHFLFLCFLLLRTRLHSNGAPLPSKASLVLSSTLYLSRTSFFFHSFSQTSPALIHLVLTHTSPFVHFFCVLFQKIVCLVLHFFNRPSFSLSSFLLRTVFFSGTFAHVPLTLVPFAPAKSFLPSFFVPKNSSNPSSSSHCIPIWFFFCQSSSCFCSSLSICKLSQCCLTLCPAVLCAVALASSCALAFSLVPATTS